MSSLTPKKPSSPQRDSEANPPVKKKSILPVLLLIFFVLVFLVSGGFLLMENVISPYFADKSMDEIQTVLEEQGGEPVESDTQESSEEITKETGETVVVPINDTVKAVRSLRETYPDMVGWIKIPGTDVHFPVMQSSQEDPEYYLYRNYKGEDIRYGSIFLDTECSVEGDNQVLHGHSMLDGRMFYCLIDFSDPEVCRNSPVIQYDTYEEAGKWKIVSVFKTNTYYSQGEPFFYIRGDFANTEEKMQFIYECMQRSTVDTGVDITDTDRFLMLSTCSYEFDGFRTVVVARKVRPGEDDSVDTSAIKAAENPLYPDIWYQEYGGEKPQWPENFRDAVSAGLTPWYHPEN